MRPPEYVLEWVEKAEDDFAGAQALSRRRPPLVDLICYHAQQCAEKYLKAFLVSRRIDFPKTHDLIELLTLVVASDPKLEELRQQMKELNAYAVSFRYPDARATSEEAAGAMRSVRRVRKALRKALGLEGSGSVLKSVQSV